MSQYFSFSPSAGARSFVYSLAYSLVELLLVIALFGVVLFLAIPAWRPTLQSGTTATQIAKVAAILEYTRVLSMKRGKNIAFCRQMDSSPQQNWSAGQVIRDEQSKDILRTITAVPAHSKLLWKGNFGRNDCLTFTPLGIPKGQQGSFYYCHDNPSLRAGRVIVQETGNIHTQLLSEQESSKACALNG